MKPTTFDELYKAVENKEIISAIDKEGNKHRLFVATNGKLCRFKPKSGRRGYAIYPSDFESYVKFQTKPAPKSEEAKAKQRYNDIAKYKRMASEATFSNSWIEDCKKLPSFEQWKKDLATDTFGTPSEPRLKGLYDLHITTGNKIDGKVISLARIAKQYPRYIEQLREAIRTQTAVEICHRTPFAGYEMTISTANKESSTGEFMGYLSLEFKGCGNGYYYLLINDENFIGYDVD